jgi:RNA polymerase sigma factor (sigma-70 family)
MLEESGRDADATQLLACGSAGYQPQQTESCTRPDLDQMFRQERLGLARYIERKAGRELASDIVQEVFLRVAKSQQIDKLDNPTAFLRCVARTVIIDRARRAKCRITTMPLIEAKDAKYDETQEHELAANDVRACLERALGSLPERTRTIFVMHRFEGMAYRDIHLELAISVATVEYHMMRALAHVRVEFSRSLSD